MRELIDYVYDKCLDKYSFSIRQEQTIDKEDFAGIETDNPERFGADYIQFVAPLIKAVQELTAKVEALENA